MTLSDRTTKQRKPLCDIRSECRRRADKEFFDALLSTRDEVLVFRRDASTGNYNMFTACCEAVLTPSNAHDRR